MSSPIRTTPVKSRVAARMLTHEIPALEGLVADSLADNEVYAPAYGLRHRLQDRRDVRHGGRHSMFRGHDELASYFGVAPVDNRSGTIVRSTSPQREGNKQLKKLLIFSCSFLVGARGRFGRSYEKCWTMGDETRLGAEVGGEKKAQGHLRGHAGRGPVLGLGLNADNPEARGRRAPRWPILKNASLYG